VIAAEFRDITKAYHRLTVLESVNLAVEAGTFTVIFGPPGCGKSILLRLLTGLEKPSSGSIFLRGADVTRMSPGERNIGYVPQAFALYPHYCVHDNIAYPLHLMGIPHREAELAVRQAAEMLHIDHLLRKTPDQLSGGEKQRVAIARGIVKHTEIFVLDDPLTGLDFKLREQLFDDLKQMQQSLQATFIYTTSDAVEALMLADHVAVVDNGRVVEAGPLEQLCWDPHCVQTMVLLAFPQANLLTGELFSRAGQAWCRTNLFEFPVQLESRAAVPGEPRGVSVVIRPQHLVLNAAQAASLLACQAQVVLWEDLGGEVIVHLNAQGTPLVTVVRHDGDRLLSEEKVMVGVPPSAIALFAPGEGRRIGHGMEMSHV
jgi:ABC-type sugar transport system ATPase subunit